MKRELRIKRDESAEGSFLHDHVSLSQIKGQLSASGLWMFAPNKTSLLLLLLLPKQRQSRI